MFLVSFEKSSKRGNLSWCNRLSCESAGGEEDKILRLLREAPEGQRASFKRLRVRR